MVNGKLFACNGSDKLSLMSGEGAAPNDPKVALMSMACPLPRLRPKFQIVGCSRTSHDNWTIVTPSSNLIVTTHLKI